MPSIIYDPAGLARGAAGGVVIALSTSALMAAAGHTGGISGILGALARGWRSVYRWRLAFLGGLLAAGGVLRAASPSDAAVFGTPLGVHWAAGVAGGLLTGFGTRLANGCTSGHGIIGLARLSPRSLVAIAALMGSGFLTAGLARSSSIGRPALYGTKWSLGSYFLLPLAGSVVVAVALHYAAHGRRSKAPLEGDAAPTPLPDTASRAGADSDDEDSVAAAAAGGSLLTRAVAQGAVFLSSLGFGLGLGVSGMCDPNKVARFLDVAGSEGWDPQLMMVMAGGVGVNLLTFRVMATSWGAAQPPLYMATADGDPPHPKTYGALIPYGPSAAPNRVVDWKLLAGSVLFGVGWGLTGICPGPGVVSYVSGGDHAGVVLPSIIVGMAAFEAASALGWLDGSESRERGVGGGGGAGVAGSQRWPGAPGGVPTVVEAEPREGAQQQQQPRIPRGPYPHQRTTSPPLPSPNPPVRRAPLHCGALVVKRHRCPAADGELRARCGAHGGQRRRLGRPAHPRIPFVMLRCWWMDGCGTSSRWRTRPPPH